MEQTAVSPEEKLAQVVSEGLTKQSENAQRISQQFTSAGNRQKGGLASKYAGMLQNLSRDIVFATKEWSDNRTSILGTEKLGNLIENAYELNNNLRKLSNDEQFIIQDHKAVEDSIFALDDATTRVLRSVVDAAQLSSIAGTLEQMEQKWGMFNGSQTREREQLFALADDFQRELNEVLTSFKMIDKSPQPVESKREQYVVLSEMLNQLNNVAKGLRKHLPEDHK